MVLLGLTGVLIAGLLMIIEAKTARTRLIGAGVAAASVIGWFVMQLVGGD